MIAYKDLMIGADPELGVAEFEGDKIKPICAYDAVSNINDNDSFGLDGCEEIFELRPKPSPCPFKVVENIKKIFESGLKKHKESLMPLKFIAGSYVGNNPIGGHIHFGHDTLIRQNDDVYINYSKGLAYLLAIPTFLIEDNKEATKRRNYSGYGKIFDYRNNNHGFEYRSPSSWLVSPHIAAATLCLAKAAMFDLLNNPELSKHISIQTPFKGNKSVLNRTKCLEAFNKVWDDITKLSLYKIYKPHIDIYKFLISNNLTWKPKNQTLREAWGLPVESKYVDPNLEPLENINLESLFPDSYYAAN